ncbi:MAG: hypothetical protein A2068_01585 [Ignavibacteria bacterium GWB2_35_6b]|nr:MAG: hypothetical protein A2068_01585 [Ignavibacteria bacterium GWB2_35_6b]
MKRESDCKSWLSSYIYFKGDIYESECDRIILSVVKPLVLYGKEKKWFDKYFFIRYGERGSHIRLRFFGDTKKLTNNFKLYIKNYINTFADKELLSIPLSVPGQPEYDSNLIWIDYEPEIERYGGEEAVKLAEEFFCYSSEAAIELIKQMELNDRSSRLGKGLLSTLILIYVFLPDRKQASNFFNQYSGGYLMALGTTEDLKSMWVDAFNNGFDKQSEKLIEFINLIWEALENNDELSGTLDVYKNNIIIIKEKLKILFDTGVINKNGIKIENWYDCVRMIISSYVHMMNNRLGISIKEEAYISHLINKALITEKISNRNSND